MVMRDMDKVSLGVLIPLLVINFIIMAMVMFGKESLLTTLLAMFAITMVLSIAFLILDDDDKTISDIMSYTTLFLSVIVIIIVLWMVKPKTTPVQLPTAITTLFGKTKRKRRKR